MIHKSKGCLHSIYTIFIRGDCTSHYYNLSFPFPQLRSEDYLAQPIR